MSYLCNGCGNTESFNARQSFTDYGYEEIFIDGEGSINDYGERDVTDGDSDGIENVTCPECSGTVVWVEDDSELEDMRQNAVERKRIADGDGTAQELIGD